MSRQFSWLRRFVKSAARPRARVRPLVRLRVKALEDRRVPSVLGISDATAIEGGANYRFTDDFVAPNGYGLAASRELRFGPDGNLYVPSMDTNSVKVFAGGTGRYLHDLSTPGGELVKPWGMIFGPDGGLYVGARDSDNIIRFDIGTGSYTVFVATNSGGLGQVRGLAFGPDGNLYASSNVNGSNGTLETVKEYDGATGAYLRDFVTLNNNGGLTDGEGLAFGPDGNLYVASNLTQQVKRYNGQTGAFIDNFVSAGSGGIQGARDVIFPGDGYLYVAAGTVYRYSATTGAFVDVFASAPSSNTGNGIAFAPSGAFYVSEGTPTGSSGSYVARFAPTSFAAFTVSLDSASSSLVSVSFATADGTAAAGTNYAADSDTIDFAPGETSRTILIPTVDDGVADPTRSFTVSLSNPVNASLGRTQGIATILDDTKFYTVDTGSSDSTYQYANSGAPLGNNPLGSGDTAPRGVATTAAGTTEWVVDANRSVYVYNTGGTFLGSWSAGGLSSSAQVTGIATNGTDLWLVDSYTAKVYKYTGAASRLSGSQNASSSFNLTGGKNGNSNPQDIVTDGTSFWVVDGTRLKVFKYTLSGSLLGSWSIDPANTHPTGITINPNNVSDVWIVDNGTDKVYQYIGAAGRTSGSQTAGATFALAAGNTNPQGIADPPPAALLAKSGASPHAPSQPFAAAGSAVPPAAGRDAVFALLGRAALPGGTGGDLLRGGASATYLDSPSIAAAAAWTPAGAGDEQNELDLMSPLTLGTSQGGRLEANAFAILEGAMADDGPTFAAATDAVFAGLASDVTAAE